MSGVSVFKYAPLDQAPERDDLFRDANSGLEFQSFGSVYEEQIDLKVLFIQNAGLVTLLLEQLKQEQLHLQMSFDQLGDDSAINGAVIVSRMRNMTIENTLSDEGRICLVEMDIEAEATASE